MQYLQFEKNFWSVNLETGEIAQCERQQGALDFTTSLSREVQLLFERKKGERLYLDRKGCLQKSKWKWIFYSSKGVQARIHFILSRVLHIADTYMERERALPLIADNHDVSDWKDEDYAALVPETPPLIDQNQTKAVSHFFYHFMNPEGSIGRLNPNVGFKGSLEGRIFTYDRLIEHVDMVAGEHFWRVNTQTGYVSKALSAKKYRTDLGIVEDQVRTVKLSSTDTKINRNFLALFERKKGEHFRAFGATSPQSADPKYELRVVKGWKERFRYWVNKDIERTKVCKAVKDAVDHLETIVKKGDDALGIFLRAKFQGKGPMASLSVGKCKVVRGNEVYIGGHFDRTSIAESGNLEWYFAKQSLFEKRILFQEKIERFDRFPPIDPPTQVVPEEARLGVEEATLQAIMDSATRKKVNAQVTEALDRALKIELQEEMRAQIPRIADETTRRVIRQCIIEQKDPKGQIDEIVKRLSDEAMEYAFREEVRQQVKDALHDLLIEEFIFAQSLGVKLQTVGDGGSGGARYAFDRFGRKILVVKPGDEGPYGINNPRKLAWIKQLFIGIRNCLADNNECLSELSSYLVDKRFHFNIVPSTTSQTVQSSTFVRHHRKECSVQAFVDGATPMQDRLGFNDGMIKRIWAWNQNFSSREEIADRFEEKDGVFHDKLKEAIPGKENEAFARVFALFVIHNYLIGDTDCHFDNWFAKEVKIDDPKIQSLLNQDDTADCSALVEKFFTRKMQYKLHDALFHREGEVVIIKHDAGSSIPRRHPKSKFEVRLAYLFEVLPQMKDVFSEALKSLFRDRDRTCFEMIEELALLNLTNLPDNAGFLTFWNGNPQHRQKLKEWLFSTNSPQTDAKRLELAALLAGRNHGWAFWTYDSELTRIKGMADAFKDRWDVLQSFFLEVPKEVEAPYQDDADKVRDKSKRNLVTVRRQQDFDIFWRGIAPFPSHQNRQTIRERAFNKWSQEGDLARVVLRANHAVMPRITRQLVRQLNEKTRHD
ncbi:MAG: hypothetical protein H7A36_07530 [Chlamydiales bacterium]|nr:hypothetical protein [Chlamydiales bacterium]